MSSQLRIAKKKSRTPNGGSRTSVLLSTPRQSPHHKQPKQPPTNNVWWDFVSGVRPRTPFSSSKKTEQNKENVPLVHDGTNIPVLCCDDGMSSSDVDDESDSDYDDDKDKGAAKGRKKFMAKVW